MNPSSSLLRSIRIWTWIFIISLIISGLTAFPLYKELRFLQSRGHLFPTPLAAWFDRIFDSMIYIKDGHEYLSYGTDWLGFAHIIIALFFFSVLKDPARNISIVQTGIVACILIFPFAFIFGNLRGIPFWWQLIDCSFGVFGLIPLIIVYKKIKALELKS